MRDARNDAPTVSNRPQGASAATAASASTRRCLLTGETMAPAQLLRLVPGPDGLVWPDLAGRLPGRGAWVGLDRPALAAAVANGRLQSALRRAFKGPVQVPPDLCARIADGLQRRALERLGLEHRAGHLIFGTAKLAEWAAAGRLHLLLHAADARPDGSARLDQAWRVGGGSHGGIFHLPTGRESLSRALGRENVVHSGVIHGKAAARILAELKRWAAFIGKNNLTAAGLESPDRRNDEGQE